VHLDTALPSAQQRRRELEHADGIAERRHVPQQRQRHPVDLPALLASHGLAIHRGPWKLIFVNNGKRELYNLKTELGATRNVSEPNLVWVVTEETEHDFESKVLPVVRLFDERGIPLVRAARAGRP
jgi:hypothetical protein